MTVLVTGGGGFIGSHLVEELFHRGEKVRAFVRYTSRNDVGNLRFLDPATRAKVEVVAGDLRDPGAVREAMRGCRRVFHLGALIAIPYSYVHPREVVETNVLGTLNVLEAARAERPERVVHVSTSEVYGTARFVPITEQHPLQGQSPYSASKIGADKLAESYAKAFEVPVLTIRPFNTYGPRQSGRAVIPTIIAQALVGDCVRLGDLAPTRDFTFVTDTARALAMAGDADGREWSELNLGTDTEISVGDLAALIIGLVGRDVPVEQEDLRRRPPNSEVERLRSTYDLARQRLGWEPTVTFDDGLRETIAWVKDHPAMYSPGTYEV